MKTNMSMTEAIGLAEHNVKRGGDFIFLKVNVGYWYQVPVSPKYPRNKELRNTRALYAIQLMYGVDGHPFPWICDVLVQPGSLREIVKMAIAEIERSYK